MASCQTGQWVATAPYVKLTVTISSSTATSATLSYTLQYIAESPAEASARSYTVTIAGTTVASGSYAINGKTGTYTITSGTKTITKGTSAQSISFGVSFAFNLTWSGVYRGTLSASSSISVPAKTSYTVSYNANGGSGAPSSQTKWHGTNLTLSSTTPTKTGYSFKGWATSSSGSVAYSAGGTYSANASVTLYAVWQANTYTVSYNANGGSGAPANQTKTYGVNLTLSSTKPTRTNYNFLGWGVSASSTTVSYASGATYTNNAAITLYAVWELAYIPPTITELTVNRCTSDGTADDFGTYANIDFAWECCQLTGTNNVSSILIQYKLSSATTWTDITVTASGISGNVSQVIGDDALDIDSVYNVKITITDEMDGTSYATRNIPAAKFLIDFLSGGGGVAIGKPAQTDDLFEVDFNSQFNKDITVAGGALIGGVSYDQKMDSVTKYLNAAAGTDLLDTATYSSMLVELSSTNNAGLHAIFDDPFAYVQQYFYATKSSTSNRMQLAHAYRNNKMATRYYLDGTWSNWMILSTVEEGTSGIWTYEKRASGKAVCYGYDTKTVSCTTAYGSLYGGSITISLPSGLFVSGGIDAIHVTTGGSTGSGYAFFGRYASATNTGFSALFLSTASASKDITFSVEVKGKWK